MARLKVEERRRLLIDAALTVMARDGVAAATTRAICAAAGMPQSAFHYAFRSKEELLHALTESVVARHTVSAGESIGSADSFRAALEAAMRSQVAAIQADPGRQAVVYELTLLDLRAPENPGSFARWQYRLYVDRAEAVLVDLAERFGVEWTVPVRTVARLVATSVDGAALAWIAEQDTGATAAALEALVQAVASLAREPEGSGDTVKGA